MPEAEDDAYNEALAEARSSLLGADGLQGEVMQQLLETYGRMLIDIVQDLEAGAITEERARALRRSIRSRLREFSDEVGAVVGAGVTNSIDLALEGHIAAVQAAAETAGVQATIGTAFDVVPEEVMRYAMVRRGISGARTFETLARRNVLEVADDIDDAIVSALGRGESNQRLTQKIAQSLAGDDEQLQATLRSLGPRGGRTLEAIQAGVEIEPDELNRAKRLLYDARRIAVSEINSHYQQATAIGHVQSPVVDLTQWNVSLTHSGHASSPDACDVLAEQDLYGYGPGIFHPATTPAPPHPFCQCFLTAITKDPEDYGTDNRPLPENNKPSEETVRGIMDRHASEDSRTVTDAHVQRQQRMISSHLDSAYQTAESLQP